MKREEKADLRFVGPGINLTLHDVKATDMPSDFDPKVHLNPAAFTIPQFNARIGRKIKDGITVPGDFWISAGWDHLKYKVPHTVHQVSGFIDSTVYAPNSSFDWAWRDFNFEHSDGMNFIRVAAERNFGLGRASRTRQTWDTANKKWRFGLQTAASLGPFMVCAKVMFEKIKNRAQIVLYFTIKVVSLWRLKTIVHHCKTNEKNQRKRTLFKGNL